MIEASKSRFDSTEQKVASPRQLQRQYFEQRAECCMCSQRGAEVLFLAARVLAIDLWYGPTSAMILGQAPLAWLPKEAADEGSDLN